MSRMMLTFTIFLGSFLSFALEPMIGRTLLPVFGGTPSVWVTCLAAFQVLMVGGYFYARFASASRIHLSLLMLAAGWCVVAGFAKGTILASLSGLTGVPALDVLVCVLALCGVTFVLLSANATVVQVLSGGDYRLYAVSNAGSLAGLLAYPLVFEPNVALTVQWYGLGAGIVAYAALLWRAARGGGRLLPRQSARTPTVRSCPSVTENQTIEQSNNSLFPHSRGDVRAAECGYVASDAGRRAAAAVVGDSAGAVPRLVHHRFLGQGAAWPVDSAWRGGGGGGGGPRPFRAGIHGRERIRLAARRGFGARALRGDGAARVPLFDPPGEGGAAALLPLQRGGGAVGGVLTSIVAPLAFDTVAEFPVMVVVSCALLAFVAFADKGTKPWLKVVAPLFLAASLWGVVDGHVNVDLRGRVVVHRARGFFGTVQVAESKARTRKSEGRLHEFIHGNTTHGIQIRMPGEWRTPTCYFTPEACGYAILGHPKYRTGEPMRVNLVGLGVGVLFAYGRTNDYYRAYEISQDACDVAMNTNLFSFIADCPARKDVVVMDARKGLEAELAVGVEPYDVIVVDAFTGDNIPYHLSTKEAIGLYFRLLKPDGILCIHISNWHLALEPYIRKIGDDFDSPLLGFYAQGDIDRCSFGAAVAFFCRQPEKMAPPPVAGGRVRLINFSEVPPMRELPTDEKGSFLSLLRIP